MRTTKCVVFGLIVRLMVSGCTFAQSINIWPGVATGSENWKQTEQRVDVSYGRVLMNVVTPTLTPFLPEKSKATGTGVIVAPGGSCVALAIDHEGIEVAKWLQERGIAAFVLKYRIPEKRARASR